ncbi:uncharacterized protein PHALS_12192 [Plasmopara halstedii]|uniref:Transmembrane protein n=1 Tax=Plasmopara halstedii TaxID=4781 RepID=A0A0P1AKS2_PLAHL|nr:uncharacterized protein PHALS_12192 [Plasmopara halstedii]CEG41877.1 hypothetical protein PHALS_12192 [Plasmopara halstedii]|eukprot:XP_024578246.1 hypothetical protein PHALS_12192 [Plasmopara halstedii]
MEIDQDISRRNNPRWLPLLLDVILATSFVLLDVRDLSFKLQWIGLNDTTIETISLPASNLASLQPSEPFLYTNQHFQRASGWSSFLEKCDSLIHVITEEQTNGFRHVIGKNCSIGSSIRAIDLFLTSEIRADSMAWMACELLYKHRKPPLCHSTIVTQFQDRYNFINKLSSESVLLTDEVTNDPPHLKSREVYAAIPGSNVETNLIELLNVISHSVPISAAVCVKGLVINGIELQNSSIFGCGSPSFFQSFFIDSDTSRMASQFMIDKAWLKAERFEVMGMTFLLRENCISSSTIHDSNHDNGRPILDVKSRCNVSASGSLYILMILVDLTLLVLNMCSLAQISRLMLWPLWKPLIASEYQFSSVSTSKCGFEVEDYFQTLQVGMLRSSVVVWLTVISRLLTWIYMIPSAHLWSDGNFNAGTVHALLTLFRVYDLVTICVNIIWDTIVSISEDSALAFVRQTYITPLEITAISIFIAVASDSMIGPLFNEGPGRQLLIDRSSFESATAYSNTFSSRKYSSKTLFELYYPLMTTTGISVLTVGFFIVSRFCIGKLTQPSCSMHDSADAIQSEANKNLSVKSFRARSSTKMLMHSVSPLPSPTRKLIVDSSMLSASTWTNKAHNHRLPVEDMLDNPIRARSLVRFSPSLEIMSGDHLHSLHPAIFLRAGIVLVGKSMVTRYGFSSTVQSLVYAHDHTSKSESQHIGANGAIPNLR